MKQRVVMKGVISQIPYAAYTEAGELLGYSDDETGPLTLGPDMRGLPEPIEVEVIEVDESAWD